MKADKTLFSSFHSQPLGTRLGQGSALIVMCWVSPLHVYEIILINCLSSASQCPFTWIESSVSSECSCWHGRKWLLWKKRPLDPTGTQGRHFATALPVMVKVDCQCDWLERRLGDQSALFGVCLAGSVPVRLCFPIFFASSLLFLFSGFQGLSSCSLPHCSLMVFSGSQPTFDWKLRNCEPK